MCFLQSSQCRPRVLYYSVGHVGHAFYTEWAVCFIQSVGHVFYQYQSVDHVGHAFYTEWAVCFIQSVGHVFYPVSYTHLTLPTTRSV